jgi:molybdopterin-binding protein
LALLVGALVGSVTTVIHQSVITILSIEIPWGLVVSLATVASFLLGLRLVRGERVSVIFGALGVLIAVFVFSQRSTGGSVLVPDNLLGSIWAIAPTLLATIIVAWPKLPERQAK